MKIQNPERTLAALLSILLTAGCFAGCAVIADREPAEETERTEEAGQARTDEALVSAPDDRTKPEAAGPDESPADPAVSERDRPDFPAEPLLPEDGLSADFSGPADLPGILTDGSGRKYSASTLIVSLDSATDEEAARDMARRHGTEVVYFYTILSGMAVRAGRNLTEKELDALAEAFEAEPGVTGVSRDYITELDDPVTAPELMG